MEWAGGVSRQIAPTASPGSLGMVTEFISRFCNLEEPITAGRLRKSKHEIVTRSIGVLEKSDPFEVLFQPRMHETRLVKQ